MSMTKTANVNVHIAPELKREAEKALAKLSLTPEEAIEDFYQQVALTYRAGGQAWLDLPQVTCCLCWGKPPNAESLAAIKEIEEGGGVRYSSIAELRAAIENDLEDEEDADTIYLERTGTHDDIFRR